MNVIIFGATGMVGRGVLIECIENARVQSILVIGRSSCGVTHPKLKEVLHENFLDFTAIEPQMAGNDACFYCLGVSAVGIADDKYVRFTFDFTEAAAKSVFAACPNLTFCFISAEGADSTEKSRLVWARTKGRAENMLLGMSFPAVYVLRPGLIQPMKGVISRTLAYRIIYACLDPIMPLLKSWLPTRITTTVNIGRALIELGDSHSIKRGDTRRVLHNGDINVLA